MHYSKLQKWVRSGKRSNCVSAVLVALKWDDTGQGGRLGGQLFTTADASYIWGSNHRASRMLALCREVDPQSFLVKVTQSCLTLLWPHGLYSPWDSLGQNTGVGSLSLLQASFLSRDWIQVSRIAGRFFTNWAVREALKEFKKAKFNSDLVLYWIT